ncbi:hypothetical protein niasHT_018482 [Heterodera trifolii]|uniref:Secreted protein n=1 Tax=Heterodera trifolii TaxID=157864 RepID=A0ABD2KTW8_9BILA
MKMARNVLAITIFLPQLFLLLIDRTFGGICMSRGVKRSQSAPNLHQPQQQRRASEARQSSRSKTTPRSLSASSSIQSIPTQRYNEQDVQGLIKQRSLNGLTENAGKRNAKNLKGIERHGQPTLGQLLTRDTIDHANDKQSYKARQRKGKQTLAQPDHDAFNDATNEQKFGSKQRQPHGESTLGQLLVNDPEFWEEKQRNKQNTKRKNKKVADNKQKQLEKGGSRKKKGKAKGKAEKDGNKEKK